LKQHEKKASRKDAKDLLWELICGSEALIPIASFFGLHDESLSGSAAPSWIPWRLPLRLCAFALDFSVVLKVVAVYPSSQFARHAKKATASSTKKGRDDWRDPKCTTGVTGFDPRVSAKSAVQKMFVELHHPRHLQ
jgi:hypothetical protein